MGVWIETLWEPSRSDMGRKSHPSWVCGLKHLCLTLMIRCSLVTPFVGVWIETKGRSEILLNQGVTPFVGVWIETFNFIKATFGNISHTLRGCVDWNTWTIRAARSVPSHTLRGCVDWNIFILYKWIEITSHTLRGCVDWNWISTWSLRGRYLVTPFVGVWIETPMGET